MEILTIIKYTPVPIILLLIGIFFLALPIAPQLSKKNKAYSRRQVFFMGIGILILLTGIGLYLVPARDSLSGNPPPTILGVTIQTSQETGGLVYNQEVNFYDEDGNTNLIEWKLLDLSDPTQRQFIQIQNGPVDVPPEVQKIKGSVSQAWHCEGHIYEATLEVTLLDSENNRSEPVRYSIACK